MAQFIKTSRTDGRWLAERIDASELDGLETEGLISLLPDFSNNVSAVWIMNKVDPDEGTNLSVDVLTSQPSGWKTADVDDYGDDRGVIEFHPLRQSSDNRGVFCRMVPVE